MTEPTNQDLMNKLDEIQKQVTPSKVETVLTKWHYLLIAVSGTAGFITHKWKLVEHAFDLIKSLFA